MSILFGAPNKKGLKVSESLSAQGINLLRSTPKFIDATITLDHVQPAYSTYMNLLPAYMHAYATQTKTDVTLSGYSMTSFNGPLIPFTKPSMALGFTGNPPSAFIDLLKERGYTESKVQKSTVYIVNNWDSALLRQAKEHGNNVTASAPHNVINVGCLGALMVIRSVFSCFLRMHTYPAFRDEDHMNDLGPLLLVEDSRKRKAVDELERERPLRQKPSSAATSLRAPSEEMDTDDGGREAIVGRDTIHAALPARPDIPGWGDESSVPSGSGVFFRYVSELTDHDNRTVPSIIGRHFMRSLAPTPIQQHKVLDDLRSGFGVISTTECGKELSHLALCIDIGLRSQARIFPVYSEDVYLGCAVLGWGFNIQIFETVYRAVSGETLKKRIYECNPHKSVMDAISVLIGDGNEEVETSWVSVDSMLKLRKYLLSCKLTESTKDEIKKLSSKLRFRDAYWGINHSTLSKALTYISEGSSDLPHDITLHPAMMFERDVDACIWSTFGFLAPSCSFPGGPQVDLTSSSESKGRIGFKMVPLETAVREMKTIFSTKKFNKAQGTRRSGSFKDRVFDGGQAETIWSALRSAAGAMGSEKEKPQKTRAIVDEEAILNVDW